MSSEIKCYGCRYDLGNQLGHMNPGGCLYQGSSERKSLSLSSDSNFDSDNLSQNSIELPIYHPLGTKTNPIIINSQSDN